MDDKLKQAIDRRMAGATLPQASKTRILQTVTGGKGRSRMKTKRMMILVAAAVILLITGCVGVAVYRDWARQSMDDWEQDHSGTPLNLSQSYDGYTIALDEMYGSTRTVYIKGTVSRDDGKPLRTEQVTEETESIPRTQMDLVMDDKAMVDVNENSIRGGTNGPYVLPDTDQNDNKVEFVYQMYLEEWPETYTIIFQRISYVDTDLDRMQLFYGNWTFTFPTDWEPVDEILPIDQQVTLPDGAVVQLENLYLAPLGVSLDGQFLQYGQNNSYAFFAQLQLKNGEMLRGTDRGGTEDFEIQFEAFNRGLGHIGADDVQALIISNTAGDEGITIPLAG
ncbi:MAG TPA: DUF4179 domain-containing protein [Candidatus Agathobaculum merdavium]|nr:DUF4179 domain-containing protein [Candidatus Agathobaculum merdavium]